MAAQQQLHSNILETIGNTPLVKLNIITRQVNAPVYAKVEFFNPGNSVKDRIGLAMIEDAERSGKIKPGGTIIEGTSGNTGMGLAIAAAIKGYKCIFTTTDKQSKEKIDMLRAVGAKVIVCPTNVSAADPRSYYSVAARLSKEIPNSFYPNQYDNLSNREAHYKTTGPEIWEQTGGKVTAFVTGVGTGGTISGVAKYLKEKNPDIKIYGIDTYGSVYKKYHETGEFDKNEIYPYLIEGIGEDILPENVDFNLIDEFVKVTDKDAYVYTRRLAREEGILAGNSCGAAVAGVLNLKDKFSPDDLVVVLLPDHASRYIGKVFNDDWMRERGFLETEVRTAGDIVELKNEEVIAVDAQSSVHDAISIMNERDVDQLLVRSDENFIGSLSESKLFQALVKNPAVKDEVISNIMEAVYPTVDPSTDVRALSNFITKDVPAVLVKQDAGTYGIITKYDIIRALAG